MPSKPTKGTVAVYLELPAELIAEVDALAERMGRTRKAEVVLAMRRHLAYPPATPALDPLPNDEQPPPPAASAEEPAAVKARGKKGGKGPPAAEPASDPPASAKSKRGKRKDGEDKPS